MDNEPRSFLLKSRKVLEAAHLLCEKGYFEESVGRSYYAMRHAATAMIMVESPGAILTKHSRVLAEFGRIFAAQKIVEQKYHRYLIEAFELRQSADYEVDVGILVSSTTALELLQKAAKFLEMAEAYCKGRGVQIT